MASDINMSLEDIIQKRKSHYRANKMGSSQPIRRNLITKPQNRIDARNKIISKKRNQISDAREKLTQLAKQRDARQKLDQLRAKRMAHVTQSMRIPLGTQKQRENSAIFQKRILQRNAVFLDPTRQVRSQQKIHMGRQIGLNKMPISRSKKFLPPLKPIVRTVENDVMVIDDDEIMMEYEPKKAPTALGRKASLNLKIIAHNTDITGKNSGLLKRYLEREREKSPPRLTSILKKRPIAALRNEKKNEKPESTRPQEYRIIVSNLGTTVTGSDIQELFGDVGGLLESRLVRPGTAEVIYKSLEDAQKAVDLYHNRQLDGQPMNCLLVSPRSAAPTSLRSSNKTSLPPSTNSNVEPDLNTFHKVLFSNF